MRLIYLSPVAWHSFAQRPHELVRYFHAQTKGQVLWIDPYPTRLPALGDIFGKRPSSPGSDGTTPGWLSLVKPRALPVEPLPFGGKVNRALWGNILQAVSGFITDDTVLGVGKPSELALQILRGHRNLASFYDAMDDFPAFYRGWSRITMAAREQRLVREVDTVLASSTALCSRLKEMHKDVRLVLNACASERLPVVCPKNKVTGRPVIGYIGTIAQWFDWELVRSIAEVNAHADVRIIGPHFGRGLPPLPANVRVEPPLPHAEALRTMAEFDVGLIPFKRTLLTSSVDPIKYYEYRGLGIPVLSTEFGEMSLRGQEDGVWLINDESDLKGAVADALSSVSEWVDIPLFRAKHSWQARFSEARLFPSPF